MGCGKGDWLNVFASHGISNYIGLDGFDVRPEELEILSHHFRHAALDEPIDLLKKFDLCICLEVAEHIAEKKVSVFFDNLTKHSDTIIFSAAIPGQGGENHVNEQPPAYWQGLFNSRGFHTYDVLRRQIWDEKEILWWYRQNIFVASKKELFTGISEEITYIVHPEHYQEKENILQGVRFSPRKCVEYFFQALKYKFSK